MVILTAFRSNNDDCYGLTAPPIIVISAFLGTSRLLAVLYELHGCMARASNHERLYRKWTPAKPSRMAASTKIHHDVYMVWWLLLPARRLLYGAQTAGNSFWWGDYPSIRSSKRLYFRY